jgi:SAM-dependent methyltransferase
LVSNAQALAFKPEAFEAVVGFDILEHVVDPGRVLAEAYRALKPGGVLHLYVPCEGNPGTIYQKRGFAIKRQWGGHVQQFTTANLCALLQKQGFKITRVRHADYSLVQQMDYAFYQKLSHSPNPSAWWAGQALQPGGGWRAWGLRSARRAASALGWLESVLCFGARGAMGAHITAQKDL